VATLKVLATKLEISQGEVIEYLLRNQEGEFMLKFRCPEFVSAQPTHPSFQDFLEVLVVNSSLWEGLVEREAEVAFSPVGKAIAWRWVGKDWETWVTSSYPFAFYVLGDYGDAGTFRIDIAPTKVTVRWGHCLENTEEAVSLIGAFNTLGFDSFSAPKLQNARVITGECYV
jgi:hypothetical protein